MQKIRLIRMQKSSIKFVCKKFDKIDSLGKKSRAQARTKILTSSKVFLPPPPGRYYGAPGPPKTI